MKKIDELYNKVLKDESLRKELLAVVSKEGGVEKFLKDHGCNVTKEELVEYFKKKRNISDEEMELIFGGKGVSSAEYLLSIYTAGIGCAIAAIYSAVDDTYKAGTAIEGKGMLCGSKEGSLLGP